jgi:hypothetical protein
MDYEPALPAYSDTEGNALIGLFFLVTAQLFFMKAQA